MQTDTNDVVGLGQRLAEAVAAGNEHRARDILSLGHIPEEHMSEALFWAVANNRKETLQLLIHAGAYTTSTSEYDKILLRIAANRGHQDILDVLLSRQPDIFVVEALASDPGINEQAAGRFRCYLIHQKLEASLSGNTTTSCLKKVKCKRAS